MICSRRSADTRVSRRSRPSPRGPVQDSRRGAGRAVNAMGSARASLYRTIFPQMTNWLPEEEGAQLRFDFETELARLEAA